MTYRSPSLLFKSSVILSSAVVIALSATAAEAQTRRATAPSVEVHLEVLKSLRASDTRTTATVQPELERPVSPQTRKPAPSAPAAKAANLAPARYEAAAPVKAAPAPARFEPAAPRIVPATVAPAKKEVKPAAPKVVEAKAPEPKAIEPKAIEPKVVEAPKPAPKVEAPMAPETKVAPQPKVIEKAPVPAPAPVSAPIPLPVPPKVEAPKVEAPAAKITLDPAPVEFEEITPEELPELAPIPTPAPAPLPVPPAVEKKSPIANPPKKGDLPPPLPALPPLGALEAEPEELPLPTKAPQPEPVIEPIVEPVAIPAPVPAPVPEQPALELPPEPMIEPMAEPVELPPEPVDDAANALPEAELESLPALTEKQNVAPVKVEKPGMFSGLTAKMGSLLGKKEEPAKPQPVTEEEPAPEAEPMAEPAPLADESAEPMAEEAAAPALPALPALPKSSAATAPELPKLPPLPKENVDAVPVTDTNRALPKLDALKSQSAKPHEPSIAKAQPVPKVSEKELPALPSLNKKEATEVAKVAALDAAKEKAEAEKAKAPVELELPPLPEAVEPVAEKVDAAKKEVELASLPPEPAAAPKSDAKKSDAKKSDARAPEFGFDKENRKQLHLYFSRDDHDVASGMHSQLNELAKTLKADNSKTLVVASYAGSNADDAIVSKRVALSRAVNVRRYLIEAGVDSSRINVQPLGNQGGHENPERVDITLK